ncbi:hypothetical protein LOK49_LG10G03011 [Camellia lanceoleosa]|uniref:Uncharacterized protein n=1 Tax=Camellia lanceoleosa TaxID=1840588 RepID=A0ACC0GER2_9ERIC|nr:hypothetical protein LOK49_LG10G03011 [Camellia lanceoleosa]
MATMTKKSITKIFLHEHTLELNDKMEEYKLKCCVCNQGISDWHHYRCSMCSKTRIHEYPCSEIPLQIDHHPLHPHHSSFFASSSESDSDLCDFCGETCKGAYMYKCIDCPFVLDVKCALLTATATKKIQFQKQQQKPNHSHPLILCDMVKSFDYTCCCCGLTIDGDCVYVCLQCKGLFHNSCAELPLEIKHPFHSSHPLVLSQPLEHHFFNCGVCHQKLHRLNYLCSMCRFVLDVNCARLKPEQDRPDEDDNAEFYCDACEKRRDLAQPTYYCKDGCQFVAHPHCVVSEESLVLTLKEFLDSFTEDENKEVQGLFKAYIWDVREKSGSLPRILGFGDSYAYLDKVSTWILKKYVSRVEIAMPWEKWDTTSKVIKDGHFMILENQISILKALFSKYKDFSIGSRLSTKATMLFVMTICEAIHSMCNTKVMDITTSLLLTWFNSFAFAQYAGFEILFVIDHLTKLVRAHFGFQVGHDVLITKQHTGIDSKDIAIIEEDEESIDSKELAITEEDKEIVNSEELTIIEGDEEILNSEDLAIIEDEETHYLWEKVDSMQLTIIKLDEAIKELGKKKQALLKKRKRWCIRKECLIDALELEGQMAGTRLL